MGTTAHHHLRTHCNKGCVVKIILWGILFWINLSKLWSNHSWSSWHWMSSRLSLTCPNISGGFSSSCAKPLRNSICFTAQWADSERDARPLLQMIWRRQWNSDEQLYQINILWINSSSGLEHVLGISMFSNLVFRISQKRKEISLKHWKDAASFLPNQTNIKIGGKEQITI